MVVMSPPLVAGPGCSCASVQGGLPTPVRRGMADPAAADALACALSRACADGDAADRDDMPVVVAAPAYNTFAADRFVRRHEDPGCRLLPSDSMALESSGLLQQFAAATGWSGTCFLITTERDAAREALLWASGMVNSRRYRSVVVGEVVPAPVRGFWAVAARLWTDPAHAAGELPDKRGERAQCAAAVRPDGADGPVSVLTRLHSWAAGSEGEAAALLTTEAIEIFFTKQPADHESVQVAP